MRFQRRLRLLYVLFCAALGIIWLRAGQLQVLDGDERVLVRVLLPVLEAVGQVDAHALERDVAGGEDVDGGGPHDLDAHRAARVRAKARVVTKLDGARVGDVANPVDGSQSCSRPEVLGVIRLVAHLS